MIDPVTRKCDIPIWVVELVSEELENGQFKPEVNVLLMLLILNDNLKISGGFSPDIFLDIQFHMNNGTYSWRNGPEIKLTEWLFTGIAAPNHPYVPKWIYFRSLFVKFPPFLDNFDRLE